MPKDDGVQHLLYVVVIMEKRCTVEAIAELTGYRPATVYDFLERRPIVPVSVIKGTYTLTHDPRIRQVLEPQGFKLRPAGERIPEKSLMGKVGDIYLAVSKTHQRIIDALDPASEGGTIITSTEITDIERELDATEREIGDVRSHVEQLKAQSRMRAIQ